MCLDVSSNSSPSAWKVLLLRYIACIFLHDGPSSPVVSFHTFFIPYICQNQEHFLGGPSIRQIHTVHVTELIQRCPAAQRPTCQLIDGPALCTCSNGDRCSRTADPSTTDSGLASQNINGQLKMEKEDPRESKVFQRAGDSFRSLVRDIFPSYFLARSALSRI